MVCEGEAASKWGLTRRMARGRRAPLDKDWTERR